MKYLLKRLHYSYMTVVTLLLSFVLRGESGDREFTYAPEYGVKRPNPEYLDRLRKIREADTANTSTPKDTVPMLDIDSIEKSAEPDTIQE